jgi:hypothetical protein
MEKKVKMGWTSSWNETFTWLSMMLIGTIKLDVRWTSHIMQFHELKDDNLAKAIWTSKVA